MATNKFDLLKFKSDGEWNKARLDSITATSAGSIMGVNNWETALDVYIKITTKKEKKVADTEFMARGRNYESIVRHIFAIRHQEYRVIEPPKHNWLIRNKENSWWAATPDGLLKAKSRYIGGVECKYHLIRGKSDEERWVNGILPDQYYVQVIHTINASGRQFKEYYLAVLLEHQKPSDEKKWTFDNLEYREYRFVTKEIVEDLNREQKAVNNFIENNIKKKVIPGVKL